MHNGRTTTQNVQAAAATAVPLLGIILTKVYFSIFFSSSFKCTRYWLFFAVVVAVWRAHCNLQSHGHRSYLFICQETCDTKLPTGEMYCRFHLQFSFAQIIAEFDYVACAATKLLHTSTFRDEKMQLMRPRTFEQRKSVRQTKNTNNKVEKEEPTFLNDKTQFREPFVALHPNWKAYQSFCIHLKLIAFNLKSKLKTETEKKKISHKKKKRWSSNCNIVHIHIKYKL